MASRIGLRGRLRQNMLPMPNAVIHQPDAHPLHGLPEGDNLVRCHGFHDANANTERG